MDLAATSALPSGRLAQADLLFSAPSYSDWVKLGMRLRATRPDTAVVFESTIAEPVAELVDVLRHAFSLHTTSRYVSVFAGGNPFAKAALARRYGVPESHIQTTTGATSGLAMVFKALVQPSDHVLVETPGFDLLTALARESGAHVEPLSRLAPDFQVDIADLRRKLRRDTRAIVLTNLHNPSGALLAPQALAEIAAVADEVGAVVVIDEVYADFARPALGQAAVTLAHNVVTVSSLTKAFGLFALKCGWICASPEFLETLRGVLPDGDIGISKLSHSVAALVLEEPEVFDAHWKRVLAQTRPAAQRHLDAMTADGLLELRFPDHGCMAFPKVVGVDDTQALAKTLWIRHGVLVAPGEYFGAPGHIRLGFGADVAAINGGFGRLHVALAEARDMRTGPLKLGTSR